MSDRIQKALDGEVPRERLSPSERAELGAYEEAVDASLAPLRAEPAPDVTAGVMRRVEALPVHRSARTAPWKAALEWLWAPRPVSLRPAWGLAAAALAGVLLLAPWRSEGPAAIDPASGDAGAAALAAAGAPADPQVFVHFRLDVADARSVQLAADFTGWQPAYTLSETALGVWTVVVPVDPGVHQYGFVVDGDRWVADPLAPRVDDGFGGANSRLDVVTPAPRRAL